MIAFNLVDGVCHLAKKLLRSYQVRAPVAFSASSSTSWPVQRMHAHYCIKQVRA